MNETSVKLHHLIRCAHVAIGCVYYVASRDKRKLDLREEWEVDQYREAIKRHGRMLVTLMARSIMYMEANMYYTPGKT